MNIIHKIIGIVVAGFMLASAQAFCAAGIDTYPDTQPEARSVVRPGGLTPITPGGLVQLGVPDRSGSVPAVIGSFAVYSALNPVLNSWFVQGGAMDQPGVRHFNFDPMYKGPSDIDPTPGPYWSLTHTQVASPLPTKNTGSGEARVYFVDNQAGYNNTLGVQINGTSKLVFPFITQTVNSAAGHSPTFNSAVPNSEDPDLARFAQLTSPGGFQLASEHPLLLSDAVIFNLRSGDLLNFFVMTDINVLDAAGNIYPAVSNDSTWNTDPALNTDNAGDPRDILDQHFHFYLIPELASDPAFSGRANYLVSVEDLRFNVADLDFNDLMFIISLPVPEPRIYILIGSLLALALIVARKQQKDVE